MESNIFIQLAIILAATKVFGLLSKRVHMPQVVGALLAGIILGPAMLKLVDQNEMINVLAEIGVILLMFTAGLETDLKQLRSSLKSSVVIAVTGVTVPLGGGFALAHFFGFDLMQSIFIGVILTATSISITVEALREMGKLKSKTGTLILGAAVIDDILGVIILSVIIGMNGGGTSFQAGWILLKICGFFVSAWIVGFFMFRLVEHLSNKYGNVRRLPILSLAFCFFLAYLAEQFGIASITGAYIAGLTLCGSKAERYVEKRSNELSYLFFSPVFFVSVGLYSSFDGIGGSTVIFAALLLIVAIATKLVGCGLGAKICGLSTRESVQIGAGMVCRGEVAIIIATKGIIEGLLSSALFSVVIIVIIITTLITPLLLKWAYSKGSVKQ